MPNTLAHLGVQGLVTRGVVRDADLRWVLLGCVVPDVPWILQRIIGIAWPGLDPYSARAYAVAQASLLCCLLLSAALAAATRAPGRVFAVLATGSLLHLVLDALQTKWANGVHLFAPASWKLWNAGFFWPESPVTHLLTAFGLAWTLWAILRSPGRRDGFGGVAVSHRLVAALLFALYALLPALLAYGPERADNHYISTLRERDARTGRVLELDRIPYLPHPAGDRVRTWANEELKVVGRGHAGADTVSLRGRFVSPDAIAIEALHRHLPGWRDTAATAGLALVALAWLRPPRGSS